MDIFIVKYMYNMYVCVLTYLHALLNEMFNLFFYGSHIISHFDMYIYMSTCIRL